MTTEPDHNRRTSRRSMLQAAAAFVCHATAVGCMGPIFRPQSPDAALSDANLKLDPPSQTQLVSAVAHPYGMNYVKVENVALVTGLAGTGEDPAPSSQRAALLSEMNRRGIENPNEVLASPNTALVLVRAFLRPGLQAGDKIDVEVNTPSRSGTTSLRGGMLLETRLSEAAALGGQIHYGHEAAIAQGAILVDPSASADKGDALATKGRVLSGGVAIKARQIGLVLDHQHKTIRMSQTVAKSINDRFAVYVDSRRMGVATPKTDEYIELTLHPRYKENVGRYMRVVRNVAVRETPAKRLERLDLLRDQLMDPVTAETAALRLEAIGAEGVDVLKIGAKSTDPEVRFYSAEALAYLDVTEAVAPLASAAINEPAFRIAALAALGSMEDGAASESLFDMLKLKSAETRYGAFRALTLMAPDDPRIRGERLAGRFNFHRLNVEGPAMIHVTSSHKPELVMFGGPHELRLPIVLDAGQRILVNGLRNNEIKVSRFGPNEPTQERIVSTNVEDVIRAVVDLGGDYPDVVQMLQQAKNAGALSGRFRVNALPEPGREFDREHEKELEKEAEPAAEKVDSELLTSAE